MIKNIMLSPYPWHYTLRWPIYFNWPSVRNHTHMDLVPDQYNFYPNKVQTVRLLFCGDIMVQNKDKTPQLHPELCHLIQSADLFIGNCESPVDTHLPNDQAKYQFTFNMPRAYLENIISQTSLAPEQWLLSMANNHTGDQGYEICLRTEEILKDIGVIPLGRYLSNQPPLHIIRYKNLNLGFIAWTEWMNREIFPSKDPGAFRNEHVLAHSWKTIKSTYHLDYLIGIPHWEYEFQHFPHQQTRLLAKHLINELGIDCLVGIHTHTLQPMEWFEGGVCAYNLGNFCGLARAWPVKLIPLLEVNLCLTPGSLHKLVSYKMHYFFQQHTSKSVNIIPLNEAPALEQKRLIKRINQIFITTQNKN